MQKVQAAQNFYPRPPRGGRRGTAYRRLTFKNFYPRPPRGGRLRSRGYLSEPESISIHALREEGDVSTAGLVPVDDISIHALREEGDAKQAVLSGQEKISIHALREEGDSNDLIAERQRANFYPRPPRGGRPVKPSSWMPYSLFLSTPSARRATIRQERQILPWSDFYPRPPRGGRLAPVPHQSGLKVYFYPRPPRGGRQYWVFEGRTDRKFLSTPSARRATAGTILAGALLGISIHALREEGDFL